MLKILQWLALGSAAVIGTMNIVIDGEYTLGSTQLLVALLWFVIIKLSDIIIELKKEDNVKRIVL